MTHRFSYLFPVVITCGDILTKSANLENLISDFGKSFTDDANLHRRRFALMAQFFFSYREYSRGGIQCPRQERIKLLFSVLVFLNGSYSETRYLVLKRSEW